MAVTPLYVRLLRDGERLYIFPGASEDLSTATYNENQKIYFTKAVFLNIPSENIEEGIGDTEDKFYIPDSKFNYFTQSYADRLVDGLRSYVANADQVIRENLDEDGKYTYDPRHTRNITERLFWKWLQRNNILQIESAIPYEDYNPDDEDLRNPTGNSGIEYHPMRLWRERKVEPIPLLDRNGVELVEEIGEQVIELDSDSDDDDYYSSSHSVVVPTHYRIKIRTIDETNLRNGDWILINGVANLVVPNYFKIIQKINKSEFVIEVPREHTIANGTPNNLSPESWDEKIPGILRQVMLKYSRVIVNINEIQSVNPIQVGSRSWTEITTYLPSSVGQTPIVLFQTVADRNYGPNMVFPQSSEKQQEEILGAESPQSPININPENFPGDKWAIFDKNLADVFGDGTSGGFIYLTSAGDSIRQYGDYYGVYALRNTDTDLDLFDPSRIDGLVIDFNLKHYIDSGITEDNNKVINTWQEFSSSSFRGSKPKNFEFNAIAWFYDLVYDDGVTYERSSNLFGLTILGHPDDNPKPHEKGKRIPTIKKIVADGERTGTSHVFTLNNYLNLADPIPTIVRDDISSNNAFGFELFNKAMNEMSQLNELFKISQGKFAKIAETVEQLASTHWTQTQLDTLNNRISILENLLSLYSTMQLRDSDTIRQQTINIGNRVYTQLNNISPFFSIIYNIISENNNRFRSYVVPDGRNILIRYSNDNNINKPLNHEDKVYLIGNIRVGQMIRLEITSTLSSNRNAGLRLIYRIGNTDILMFSTSYLPISYRDNNNPGYIRRYGSLPPIRVSSISGVLSATSSLPNRREIDVIGVPNLTSFLNKGDQILLKDALRSGVSIERSMIVHSVSTSKIIVVESEGASSLPMSSTISTTVSIPSKIIVDIFRVSNTRTDSDFITNINYY